MPAPLRLPLASLPVHLEAPDGYSLLVWSSVSFAAAGGMSFASHFEHRIESRELAVWALDEERPGYLVVTFRPLHKSPQKALTIHGQRTADAS